MINCFHINSNRKEAIARIIIKNNDNKIFSNKYIAVNVAIAFAIAQLIAIIRSLCPKKAAISESALTKAYGDSLVSETWLI